MDALVRSLAIICTAALAHSVAAQPEAFADAQQVDQGIADRTAISNSLRLIQPDLRRAAGFGSLFRLAEEPGSPLARFDGGITAMFPNSAYATTLFGDFALIPPGTQFVIGEPPAWLMRQYGLEAATPGFAHGDTKLSRRIDLRVRHEDAGRRTSPSSAGEPGVRDLLRAAARAEQRRRASGG